MSRIGKMPIVVPADCKVEIEGKNVSVKGPKGELKMTVHNLIDAKLDNGTIHVTREGDTKEERALDEIPGITIDVPQPNRIVISGPDRQAVGQFAAEIREIRPPEPYKGKGIKYVDETIIRKVGKAGGKK